MKVLIIDDDPIVPKIIRLFVKRQSDAETHIFQNGKDALNYIQNDESKESALVFLDLNMPVMDGWAFLDECEKRAYNSRLKVVILTSSVFKDDYERAQKYTWIYGYFHKPLKGSDIFKILQENDIQVLNEEFKVK